MEKILDPQITIKMKQSLLQSFLQKSLQRLYLHDTKVLLVSVEPSFDLKNTLFIMQTAAIFKLAAIRKLNGEVVVEQIGFPIRNLIRLIKPFKFEEVFSNRMIKQSNRISIAVSLIIIRYKMI